MIPEAAVEAAAKAAWEASRRTPWSEAGEGEEAASLTYMRTALEAAAPHMLREAQAEAWDHGEVTGYWKAKEDNPQNGPNPYRPTP